MCHGYKLVWTSVSFKYGFKSWCYHLWEMVSWEKWLKFLHLHFIYNKVNPYDYCKWRNFQVLQRWLINENFWSTGRQLFPKKKGKILKHLPHLIAIKIFFSFMQVVRYKDCNGQKKGRAANGIYFCSHSVFSGSSHHSPLASIRCMKQ